MSYQTKCPACEKPIYFPDPEDFSHEALKAVCIQCQYHYGLAYGTVQQLSDSLEPLPSRRAKGQSRYQRRYELRLITLDGALKVFDFKRPSEEKPFSAVAGDCVCVFYTLRGSAVDELIAVTNHTTDSCLALSSPDRKARAFGRSTGLGVFLTGAVLATFVHDPVNTILLVSAIPSSIYAGFAAMRLKSSKLRQEPDLPRLVSEQKLLAQKFDLEQRVAALRQEHSANQKLLTRLQALKQKMLDVGREIYANRIEQVTRAIDILAKQQSFTQNLIAGYIQVTKIVEIEFETSQLADQLPEDISGQILARLEELRAIEAKKSELALLVEPQKLLSPT
jgi:hypothetical protein